MNAATDPPEASTAAEADPRSKPAFITTADGDELVLDPLFRSLASVRQNPAKRRRPSTLWNIDLASSTYEVGNYCRTVLDNGDIYLATVIRSIEWRDRKAEPTAREIAEAEFLGGFRNWQSRHQLDVERDERRLSDDKEDES